jgi:hypothetical protein
MGMPFIAVDGNGSEVWVQHGTGVVNEIKSSGGGKSFQIAMKVDGLNRPVQGWVNADEDLYARALELKESGQEVKFRIESQRKAKIDPTTPIAELRKTTEIASASVTNIFAVLDGVTSSEAVTNPDLDPAPGGRVRATATVPSNSSAPGPVSTVTVDRLKDAVNSGFPASVTQMLATVLLSQGASMNDVMDALIGGSGAKDKQDRPAVRNSFAREEPAWKPFNSDGRVNYGSSIITGGVGSETFVRSHLVKNDVVQVENFNVDSTEDLIELILENVMDIADHAQVAMYGEGYAVDRGANSHARARGVVYDSIDHYYPVTQEVLNGDIDAWKSQVLTLAIRRLSTAAKVALNNAEPAPETPPTKSSRPAAPAKATSIWDEPEAADFYNPSVFEGPSSEEKANGETIQRLKELVEESGVTELRHVSMLLGLTFNTPRANEIRNDLLEEFLDHYVSRGEEVFAAATEWAAKH